MASKAPLTVEHLFYTMNAESTASHFIAAPIVGIHHGECMGQQRAEDGDVPIGDRLLTARQAMNILHVSRSTLYKLIRRGTLHPLHIGRGLRFAATEVRTYMRTLMDAARGR